LLKEQEFVIDGYTEPEGTRQFFGSIIVGFYRGKKPIFAGKVGTGAPLTAGANGQGITASEMRLCHWVEPQMVCQVKFAEWTRDERLRQPVFLGLREDKDAKELVRETREMGNLLRRGQRHRRISANVAR
jgi:bifunctional non-homologous end joining protein LigD